MSEAFWSVPNPRYTVWANGLPKDLFLEAISKINEVMAAAHRQSRVRAAQPRTARPERKSTAALKLISGGRRDVPRS